MIRCSAGTRVLAAGLAAAAIAGCGGGGSGGEAPGRPARFVSPGGHDGGDCRARTSACRTLGFAYGRAADGDRVVLLAGSYGELTLARVPDHAPAVELTAERGALMDSLSVAANRVTVRGIGARAVSVDAGDTGATPVQDVRLAGVRAKTLWIRRAVRLRVTGGSFGDSDDIPPVQLGAGAPSQDVRFERVLFHDARATRADVHTECMWAAGVQGLVIRHSRFRNCAYFDIFFTRMDGPDPRDVLVEHTALGSTVDWQGTPQPFAVNVANWVRRADNFSFRSNTFEGDITFQPAVVSRVSLTGNRGVMRSCRDGVHYAGNTWTGGPCSAHDRAAGS